MNIMKRYFLVIISAIFSLGGMYADNISVTNIEIEAGETKTVSVCLENTETNLVGFQMDITLPEGITINKSGCALSSRFTDNDQELTIGKQAEGTYRLTSTSLSLNPISGTSGELLTIALTAGESTEGGTANFSNIRFVTSNSERITLSDVSFTISIAITNITFADENVKAICVANWDTNGDGELSYVEAAAVTNLGEVFKSNKEIKSFDELQYFTGLTSIGDFAFYHCDGLTSLTIPNSVASIGLSSFSGCSCLTSITVESGNTTYDSRDNCNAIIESSSNTLITGCKSTIIPNSVTSIGQYAFYICSGLTNITIPKSITSIGHFAFAHCSGLTSLIIPNSVTSIGWQAFSYCGGLASISVESGNTTYDSRDNCNAIIESSSNTLIAGCKNTVIPNSLASIGDYAFAGCCTTALTIPNTVTSIGSWAFMDCNDLTSITIPNSITSISNGTFANCSNLTSITIPNSVTSIGNNAFNWCRALTEVTVEMSDPVSIEEGTFSNRVNATLYVPKGSKEAYETADYWEEFKEIVEYATDNPIPFADSKVKEICVANWDTNGDGELSYAEAAAVTDLGEVFKENQNITSFDELQYFTGLQSIGDYTFYYCKGLTSIIIPNSVTSIDGKAFLDCKSLTCITIPNSVSSIGEMVFRGCSGFTSLNVENGNSYYDSRDNCNAIIETSTNTLIVGCKNTLIPNSVTAIGNYAFYDRTDMTSITIPNSVTSIGAYAFFFCKGLTSITIPNSVTSIGSHAFDCCSALTNITIPNSVTSIGVSAFSYCRSLTSITIPKSVTYIGKDAFYTDSDMESIIVESGNNYYDSRDNCNAIIETSTNTLIVGCKNTLIPNSVTAIGRSAFTGCNCNGLTSITIPNSVTSIGEYAFWKCNGLTSIDIPNSVTIIGDEAFRYCDNLTVVKVGMASPVAITEEVFSNRANATLYVPKGSKAAYEIADYWKEFKEIVEVSSAVDDSNSLYADNITALIGNTASFSIMMKNTESISGFQFTMTLPEGVSVATDGNGNLKATLSSRGSNAFFNANLASDGTYRCSSFLSNGSFSGEDGELVNFTLDIASDMAVGDYQVNISNIELTTTSLEKINPSDVSATISVKDYDLGDANGDGGVSITDAVTIVYHINGIDVPNFIGAAADVNKDNSISITDAVSVVYIINGLYTASAKSLGGTTEPGPSYLTLSQKERNALSVGLMNSSEYTAFQMDVKLPETMNVENVVLNKERMGAHSVYFNRTDERTVRISCFSPRGECISNSMGEILQLVLSGNGSGEVSIDNILFTTTSLDEHELLSISTMATAISDVNMGNAMLLRGNTLVINSDEEKDLNIYTISGHLYRRVHLSVGMNKLEGFQRGVYVINGKKMTIK